MKILSRLFGWLPPRVCALCGLVSPARNAGARCSCCGHAPGRSTPRADPSAR